MLFALFLFFFLETYLAVSAKVPIFAENKS